MVGTKFNALIKLLLSYVIVFILPILVILFYFYPTNIDMAKSKIMDSNLDIVRYTQKIIDLQLTNIFRIPNEFAQNPHLRNNYLDKNNFNEIRAIQEIRKYIVNNAFVENAFLYIFKQEKLYSKLGAHTIEDFGKQVYIYPDWDHGSLINDLRDLRDPIVRPSEVVISDIANRVISRYINFAFPIPMGNDSPYASVLIHVKDETINDMFRTVHEQYKGNIIIADHDGRIITFSQRTPYLESNDFSNYAQSLGREVSSKTIKMGAEEFIINSVPSRKIDWNYISLVPVKPALYDVRELQIMALFLFVGVFIIEIVLIMVSLRVNYKPIKSLLCFVRQQMDTKSDSEFVVRENMTEFETIQAALTHLLRTSDSLNKQITSNGLAMRDALLQKLIAGRFDNRKEFQEKAAKLDIHLDFPYSVIALLKFDDSKKTSFISGLESIYLFEDNCNSISDSIKLYFTPDIRVNHVIAVISCKDKDHTRVKTALANLQKSLWTSNNIQVLIGIGACTDKINNAQFSYNTASYALDYVFTKQKESIMVYDEELKHASSLNSYPFEAIYNLKYAVLQHNKAKTYECVEKVITIINDKRASLFIVKALFMEVMQFITKTIKDYGPDFEEKTALKENLVFNSSEFTVPQMTMTIKAAIERLIGFFKNGDGIENKDILEDILTYINENFSENNFSIKTIADEYAMSVSNFSHYFKHHTGYNFSYYVNTLRIEKAKDLLTETEFTTDEIAQFLNYSSASSFGRIFKKITGFTPGTYRSKNR